MLVSDIQNVNTVKLKYNLFTTKIPPTPIKNIKTIPMNNVLIKLPPATKCSHNISENLSEKSSQLLNQAISKQLL